MLTMAIHYVISRFVPSSCGKYLVSLALCCRLAVVLVVILSPYCRIGPCRMAEVCRKGTLGSVLAWRAASLLLIRLLFVLKPPLWEKEDKLQSEPVGAWLKKYTYSLLMELFSGTWLQEYSTMSRVLGILRNILYSIEYSVGNSTHAEFSKS